MTLLPSQNSALRAVAWTLGAILPWATMAAVIDAALRMISSSQLLFWSFAFATPATFLWDRLLGGRATIEAFRIPPPILAIGLLGIFGWTARVMLSLDRAPVIEANLLTYDGGHVAPGGREVLCRVVDGRIVIPPPTAMVEAAWLVIGPLSFAFVCWDRAVTTDRLALVGRLSYLDPLASTLLLMIFMRLVMQL